MTTKSGSGVLQNSNRNDSQGRRTSAADLHSLRQPNVAPRRPTSVDFRTLSGAAVRLSARSRFLLVSTWHTPLDLRLQQLVPCRARCRSLSGSIFEGPTRASPRVAQSGPFTSWAFDHG